MPGQTREALGRGPYGKRQREDPKRCAGSGQALGEAGPELVLDVLGVGQVPVQFPGGTAERAGAEPGARRGGAPASGAPDPASWPWARRAGSATRGGMEAGGLADSLLSGACVLFTLGMFSTGLSDLKHMRMTRSVDSVQFLPFLTTDVNNLSWLSYGALKGNWTLIVVNAVGAVLQTLYILVYLHYCHRKRAVLLQTTTLLGVLVLGFAYFWLLVPDPEMRLQHLGLFCSVFTISMYLSPLADLAKVIRTKSTQRLSFSLTIATLLTSASWTLYGFRLRDPYIVVPNLPGILTSFIRFWLFWKYSPGTRQELSASTNPREFT